MENNRPKAALINSTWYTAAREVLTPAELGNLLVWCVDYVLTGEAPKTQKNTLYALFRMAKVALDSDIEAYAARCERNRINANSKRVGASGSESQRVAPNINHNINNNINNNDNSISLTDEIGERERYDIIYLFFKRGAKCPLDEYEEFFAYYSALGWRNNKGAPIVRRIAAARMWAFKKGTRVLPDLFQMYGDAMLSADVPDGGIFGYLRDIQRTEDAMIITFAASAEWVKNFDESNQRALAKFMKTAGAARLSYRADPAK